MIPRRSSRTLLLLAVAIALLTAGCATDHTGAPAGSTTTGTARPTGTVGPPCPARVLAIVVTVDQWTDLVQTLAGECGRVTTIIGGTAGDPHDYEPTPGDNARFSGARLVVLNGAGYDAWGVKATQALTVRPELLDIAETVGAREGDDPHLWTDPDAVAGAATAVTAKLQAMSPEASTYFEAQARAWQLALEPYEAAIADARAKAAGRRFAATESVFDAMAEAVGLQDVTPAGFAQAAANGSEPAPGDVNDFQKALRDGQVDVLLFNAQTEGAIPDQLRDAAADAGVPVVEVTETIAPGQPGFVAWQVDQLRRLVAALDGAG